MALSLKESRAITEMAKVLYNFLPGSGSTQWKGHVSFKTVADNVGVGHFWRTGSKEPAIATLLEMTLNHERSRFEKLIVTIVREGLKYRQKKDKPIRPEEIKTLNGLIMEIGFKFPDLWDPGFLASLETEGRVRSQTILDTEESRERLREKENVTKALFLSKLRDQFYALYSFVDRNAAGHNLENVLNELFKFFDLAPREPFRVMGEQIDGSFILDSEIYLLEAKWEAQKLSEAPLLIFRGKIEGKSLFTRGVFIAINGVSSQALSAITSGKQPTFFLVDGYDLAAVLEGNTDLITMLRTKMRALAEEGKVFISVRDFR
jgi:hypothetical protein